MRKLLASLTVVLTTIILVTGCGPPVGQSGAVRSRSGVPVRRPLLPKSFIHIDMVNANTGWAIGQDNLWRTTDGGNTWHDVTPTGDSHALFHQVQNQSDFDFHGPDVAWMVGGRDYQYLYRTADGGRHWIRSSIPSNVRSYRTGTVSSLSFVNSLLGWMVINRAVAMGSEYADVYRTSDGGQKWDLVGKWDGPNLSGLAAESAQIAWMGEASVANRAFVAVTTDGGTTWQSVRLPRPPAYGANTTYWRVPLTTYPPVFFSSDGIMAVVPGVQPTVTVFYTTHDAGTTWTPGAPLTARLPDLPWSFVNASRGFASTGGTLYTTTDGGTQWSKVASTSLPGTSELDFISARQGWAIAHGQLFETKTGGKTWRNLSASATRSG